MDIHTYLRQTLKLDESVSSSSEQPLLGWLTESLAELNLAIPLEIVSVATSAHSHKYLRLSARSYLVWDMALNRTLWELCRSLQYHRMALSLQGSAEAAKYEEVAAALFRRMLFSYLSQKLARFPHTASAFALLAAEATRADFQPDVPDEPHISEFHSIQRMLMFYHEANHALLAERPELRRLANESLRQLLTKVQLLVQEEILKKDFDALYPEFRSLSDEERFSHFAEELNCDTQAFVLASMALPSVPGLKRRAWQDSVGMLFGAAAMLATFERVLKLAVSKWSDFARQSGDGQNITEGTVALHEYLSERPIFFIRRWNNMIALQAVLTRLGSALSVDAWEWAPYVMEKARGMTEAMEEHAVGNLNSLATPEFMAKVFARARLNREGHRE